MTPYRMWPESITDDFRGTWGVLFSSAFDPETWDVTPRPSVTKVIAEWLACWDRAACERMYAALTSQRALAMSESELVDYARDNPTPDFEAAREGVTYREVLDFAIEWLDLRLSDS